MADKSNAQVEVKSKKVTFDTSLPRGTCATFMHEGERWIAYPQSKVSGVSVAMEHMLATIERIRDDAVRWMNAHPESAIQAARVVERTNRLDELAAEKVKAWTA
ncbi:hypothetical protein CL96_gp017 [Mycobacterium phage Firecracker]|uniref:Uncharacterized protein n=1 Tax=Mycobacterium phage Firecracker TaxID=2922998 RepID=G8I3Z9_9CAUD|nr:hypothetical protein CL96_gp017 [Mycobacterium phage Firecracker]AER47443.1 hypothetical protein FIRECRACKER_17 [Mycobacterium phage Firecracker]